MDAVSTRRVEVGILALDEARAELLVAQQHAVALLPRALDQDQRGQREEDGEHTVSSATVPGVVGEREFQDRGGGYWWTC